MQLVHHGAADAPRPAVSASENTLSIGSISVDLLAASTDSARHLPVFVLGDGTLSLEPADRWAALIMLAPLIPGVPGAEEGDDPSPPSVDHDALVVHTWPVPALPEGDTQ